jgi:predicted O-linked N-acetylglucosamine transferase (SPINDLY family)
MQNTPKAVLADVVADLQQAQVHHAQNDVVQLKACYVRVLDRAPHLTAVRYLLALLLVQQGEVKPALMHLDQVLTDEPEHQEARRQRMRLHTDPQQRLLDCDFLLAKSPNDAHLHHIKGDFLLNAQQPTQALDSYAQALALGVQAPELYYNQGCIRSSLRQEAMAIASFERAVALKPDFAAAHYNLANSYKKLGNYAAAQLSYEQAHQLGGAGDDSLGLALHMRMQLCNWDQWDAQLAQIPAHVHAKTSAIPPFVALTTWDDLSLQQQVARHWTQTRFQAIAAGAQPLPPHEPHPRTRVGYFSPDLFNHPVAYLTAELFEKHDRSRFEVIAFSFGPPVEDEMRQRLRQGVEHFVDVSALDEDRIVTLARNMGIDVAIDLNGYTTHCRPALFAKRVAPVQISYLGFLGTMGASFMDYVVADAVLIPTPDAPFYDEKILYLPHYQVNDRQRPRQTLARTRSEWGLPEEGFVFCCFNNTYKLNPEQFALWMHLLNEVPSSVLWLLKDKPEVDERLAAQARAHGVAPERLVFAPRLSRAEYLARYAVADLFLDTLPYNAGTTASDALWMGLPVLTCAGKSMAARMAASLLQAVGLPELITQTRQDYVAQAIFLARHPEQLAQLRQRLQQQRDSAPLFDTDRFMRSWEEALVRVDARAKAGLAPQTLRMDAGGAGA